MAIRKNLIVCSDGTGNTAIKGRGTNVFKLFEAVDLHGHRRDPHLDPQIAIYDDGVGTESFKPLKLLGGAAGVGLARNVRQLYKELARVYDPGDRIFLFGFSRGAFTARTLAGMILRCGIIDVARTTTSAALEEAVDATYDAYRAGYDSKLTAAIGRVLGWKDRAGAVAALHERYRFHPDARIDFIGVWDTVDAVGLPLPISDWFNKWIYQFKFPTRDLSDRVDRAVHALAIDDERRAFKPVLWKAADGDRLEQVWFAGAHSNVGGGYPKQGMSLVALEWLLRQARERDLRVQDLDWDVIQGHASVHDKLYDPRAGLGVFYRWAPRRIAELCRKSGVPVRVHVSVLERIAQGTDDYAPGNLPFDATVVFTANSDPDADEFAERRAAAVEAVLKRAGETRRNLLAEVKRTLRRGDASYWLFLASWIPLIAVPIAAALRTGSIARVLLGFLPGLLGFVVAWGLAWRADRALDATFSGFWHGYRADLRKALRAAREAQRGEGKPPAPPLSIGVIQPPPPPGGGSGGAEASPPK